MKTTVEFTGEFTEHTRNEDDKVLERKEVLRKLAMSKQLNFLIGSGASSPAIPLMSQVEGKDKNEKNQKLLNKIREVSKSIVSADEETKENNEETKKNLSVLKSYENFILAVSDVLNNANSRQTPREATIFTTNYDLFIEKALDSVLENTSLVFNDGARGYFNRYLDGSNYNKAVSYRGLNNNYIDELPSLSLIKPHGSVNWKRVPNDKIIIKNEVVDDPVVVPPTGYEDQETFLNNHFHDMLRIFQLELDKPQSVLFVIGFSFQDKHIGKMISRALKNRELVIECFCYDNNAKEYISKNLGVKPGNLKLITPKELGEEKLTLDSLTKVLKGDN